MMSHGVHCAGYEIIIGGVPRLEMQVSSLDEVKRNREGRSCRAVRQITRRVDSER
jgi:hypothetical protein